MNSLLIKWVKVGIQNVIRIDIMFECKTKNAIGSAISNLTASANPRNSVFLSSSKVTKGTNMPKMHCGCSRYLVKYIALYINDGVHMLKRFRAMLTSIY